jgi:predicted permease
MHRSLFFTITGLLVVSVHGFTNLHSIRRTTILAPRPPRIRFESQPQQQHVRLTQQHAAAASVFVIEKAVAYASLGATAKLLASIGLGGWAGRTPNILDASAVSALSRLTYYVFQPAFLLASVSQTLRNASKASQGALPTRLLAVMPLAALLQIGLGALAGQFICRVTGIQEDEARDVRMCATFANSGPLPLIFADALFAGAPSVLGEVAACVSFYLLAWSPLFWSVGRMILGTYNNKDQEDSNKQSVAHKVAAEVKKVLSPPVIGSILGVVIGGVPIVQKAFFGGFLTPVYGALQTFGSAYLPAALLVLAGSLVGRKETVADTTSWVNGSHVAPSKSTPSKRAVFSILAARFVLAPILGVASLRVMDGLGLLGAAGTRAHAIVSFVILCEACMPPAQNSVVMLQLAGLKDRAKSMATLLTILYSLAVVPVTVLLSGCLASSGIMAFR